MFRLGILNYYLIVVGRRKISCYSSIVLPILMEIKGTKNKPPEAGFKKEFQEISALKVHISLVIMFYRFLINSTVDTGSFDAFMSKQFLYLFNGHSGIK